MTATEYTSLADELATAIAAGVVGEPRARRTAFGEWPGATVKALDDELRTAAMTLARLLASHPDEVDATE
jgi:hypothetical protein